MPKRRIAHSMAYVTAPDHETARRIARSIVEQRLAACANFWPIESTFWWRGEREDAAEFVVVFKTRDALLGKLIDSVRVMHPSEVPCIVSYPMGPALREYLAWIDAETVQR